MSAFLKYIRRDAAPYHIRSNYGRPEAQGRASYTSRTVYVGNLAFHTTDVMLYALFSRCGSIDRVIMGINRETRQPCGFAFVIFMERFPTLVAVATLNATKLDDRIIKVELDKGFHEGKQYGRGSSGGQVRDDLRGDYDEGRGGYGVAAQAALEGGQSEQQLLLLSSPPPYASRGGWRGGRGAGERGRGGRGRGGWRGGGRGGYTGANANNGYWASGVGYGGGGGGRPGETGGGKKRGREDQEGEEQGDERRGGGDRGGEEELDRYDRSHQQGDYD